MTVPVHVEVDGEYLIVRCHDTPPLRLTWHQAGLLQLALAKALDA